MKKRAMEPFLDDNVVIPDDIKNMSLEELQKAISEMENEIKSKKKS